MKRTIYVVDDEPTFRELIKSVLSRDYEVQTFAEPHALLRALERHQPHLILTDYSMPDINGLELIERIKSQYPSLPVIIITNYGSIDAAVRALKSGAFHFLEKNASGTVSTTNFTILKELIGRAIESAALREESAFYRREVETLKEQVKQLRQLELVGKSGEMESVRRMIAQVASTDATVLIRGETGTGKNLAAEIIHQLSPRAAQGKFVEINCAALPETLLEAELFGHEQGAFTDARSAKKGLLETATGGTVFLDEIDSMSALVQTKLLSFLESKRLRRVGGTEMIAVNVRIICATNAALEEKVADKKFRQDLFYRINVISFQMPPLRALGDDVILIAERFADHFAREMKKSIAGFSDSAKQSLLHRAWNGNMRELRNVIERAVIFTPSGEAMSAELLAPAPAFALPSAAPVPSIAADENVFAVEVGKTLEEVKLGYLKAVLKKCDGNFTKASSMLEISQKSLWELRKRHGIE